MNLKHAQYIKKVYEEGSITAAARKMYVSQPYISQVIKNVEKDYKIKIFESSMNPPKLTFAGEQYLKAAFKISKEEENLARIFDDINKETVGRLKIGISLQRGMQLLPEVLKLFSQAYPGVKIVLSEKGSKYLEDLVELGEVDFAFVTTTPSNNNLVYDLIETETFDLIAGLKNPLLKKYKSGESISLKCAAGESFVSLKEGHNIRFIQNRLFAHYDISPKIFLETDSVEAAMRISAICNCCMLCPHVFLEHTQGLANKLAYFPLKDLNVTRNFYACFQKGQFLPVYTRYFIDLVKQICNN